MALSGYFSSSKIWKSEYWNNRECIYIEGTSIVITEHNGHYYLSTNDEFPCYDNEVKTVEGLLSKVNKFLDKKEAKLSENLNSFKYIKQQIRKEYDSKN